MDFSLRWLRVSSFYDEYLQTFFVYTVNALDDPCDVPPGDSLFGIKGP
jgi:hypothetical protein